MAQSRALTFLFTVLFVVPLRLGLAAELHLDLTHVLEMPCLMKGEVGLQVAEVDGGKVLFDAGGEKLLIPASNVKLVLAAAALSVLGPTYSYATEILSDGPLSAAGSLQGDL